MDPCRREECNSSPVSACDKALNSTHSTIVLRLFGKSYCTTHGGGSLNLESEGKQQEAKCYRACKNKPKMFIPGWRTDGQTMNGKISFNLFR